MSPTRVGHLTGKAGHMGIRHYQELRVWQKAMDLAEEVHRLTQLLPRHELYGLTSQTRRASISIPANIAEGYGRLYRAEYIKHLSIATGSLLELETHLHLARRFRYVGDSDLARALPICDETGRMLGGLVRALRRSE
jgi:four helix bundle protein